LEKKGSKEENIEERRKAGGKIAVEKKQTGKKEGRKKFA
jgi:hypothetical protein